MFRDNIRKELLYSRYSGYERRNEVLRAIADAYWKEFGLCGARGSEHSSAALLPTRKQRGARVVFFDGGILEAEAFRAQGLTL